MNKEILKNRLKTRRNEGLEIYEDSLGYLTLGVGHLIQKGDPEYGQPVAWYTSKSRSSRFIL